jgi:uncharacterized protein (TIGR02145 family)
MKQKLFFLMLTLFVLGAANVSAQVNIGSNDNPTEGAVLDLSQVADKNLGLLLPKVELAEHATDWVLDGEPTEGMIVYNTNADVLDGEGFYGWTNLKWTSDQGTAVVTIVVTLYGSSAPPVEIPSIAIGYGRQLNYGVIPSTASNQGVTWSSSNPSIATVTPGGFVTGVSSGTVTITALAKDGSEVTGTIDFDVRGPAADAAGGFATYDYGSYVGTWMIENSTLGAEFSADHFDTYIDRAIGYYYTWDQAQADDVCPSGYSLPNTDQWARLRDFINSSNANPTEKVNWVGSAALAGFKDNDSGTWTMWGVRGCWWSSGATGTGFVGQANTGLIEGPSGTPLRVFCVRCIKN